MKKISFHKLCCFLACFLFYNVAHSGVFSITFFSRANCVNNESITWDLSKTWQMLVTSDQLQSSTGRLENLVDIQDQSNRVAAVCWGCGLSGGWEVWGDHYITTPSSSEDDEADWEDLERNCEQWIFAGNFVFVSPCQSTHAVNCNL